jgi:hypothetical protein
MASPEDPVPRFQLAPRDLLLLLIAFLAGVGAGYLLWTSPTPPGQAVLGGIAAAAATFTLLDKITASH